MNEMKLEYDRKANAIYIYLKEKIEKGEVKQTISLNDEIILDFDKDKKLIGIEIINAAKYVPKELIMEGIMA